MVHLAGGEIVEVDRGHAVPISVWPARAAP
jgi:hypothetical protein